MTTTLEPKDIPMTSHTTTRPTVRPTGFAQVLAVEFRKAVSTRAGLALLAIIAVLIVGAALATVFAFDFFASQGMGWYVHVGMTMSGPSFLVPVAVILLSTSEWSTRSAMTTFTLVPRRSQVLGAKVIVSLVIATAAWLLALGFGLLAYVAGAALNDAPIVLEAPWDMVADELGATLLLTLSAVALGFLIQNAPAAIVVVLAVPNVISGLGTMAEWLHTLVLWTNLPDALFGTLQSLEPAQPVDWARLATAVGVWIIIPGVLGWIRTLRREAS